MSFDAFLAAGALAGGLGQLAQGFGGFGSNRNAPSGNTQFWTNLARQDNFIQRRVRDATAAGVHPLFALGASTPQAVTVPGGFGGPDYASMGAGTYGVMKGLSYLTRRKEKAEVAKAEAEAKKAQSEAALAALHNVPVGTPAKPGYVPGAGTDIDEPVVPSRSLIEQIVNSEGAVNIPDVEDRLLSQFLFTPARDFGRARAARAHGKRTSVISRGGRKARAQMHYDIAMGRKRLRKKLIQKFGYAEGVRRFNRVRSRQRAYGP